MLDRVRIWDDDSGNVNYEWSNEDGTAIIHTVLPQSEWKDLRSNLIRSFPGNVSVSVLTDYLAVLCDLVNELA